MGAGAEADSVRSALLTAGCKDEALSLATGQPTAWERARAETTWYEFACRYADMKWKLVSAKYHNDIARVLTAATPALLAAGPGRPDDATIRRAPDQGRASTRSSAPIRPARLPRPWRGSPATACRCQR